MAQQQQVAAELVKLGVEEIEAASLAERYLKVYPECADEWYDADLVAEDIRSLAPYELEIKERGQRG